MTSEDEELFNSLDPNTLDPGVAKVIFATQWDEAIDFYRGVAVAAGMSHAEWLAMLGEDAQFLKKYVPIPRSMTLEKSKPFVELSDMMTLARIARYCFESLNKDSS